MVAREILERVARADGERLQRAVSGLVSGAYTVKVTERSEQGVAGYVANGDGKEYAVVLTPAVTTCSCPDSMYRHKVCKHQVILALHVVRTPEEQPSEGERKSDDVAQVRNG